MINQTAAIKLSVQLGILAAKNGGKMPYTKDGIAIMNIQFDLMWEEIYGVWL